MARTDRAVSRVGATTPATVWSPDAWPPRHGSGEAHLPDRARDDEDPRVVGPGVRRRQIEAGTVRPIRLCRADDELAVIERDVHPPARRLTIERLPLLILGVAVEIADEEHALQRRHLNRDRSALPVGCRAQREHWTIDVEIGVVALDYGAVGKPRNRLLPVCGKRRSS